MFGAWVLSLISFSLAKRLLMERTSKRSTKTFAKKILLSQKDNG